MPQLMRTSNPALSGDTFRTGEVAYGGETMTVSGAVNKTGLLVILCILSAAWTWNRFFSAAATSPEDAMASIALPAMAGGIGGFIVAMVTIFKKQWAGVTAPIYALLEGLVLGGVSAMLEFKFHGIAIQAVALTFGTLVAMLLAYRSGLIKVTDKLRLGIVAATGGIAVFYFLQFILGFFGIHFNSINGATPLGIGFSIVVVIVEPEPRARLRPDRERRTLRRSQVHGVVQRLRPDDHAGVAVLRDSAAAVEVPQPAVRTQLSAASYELNETGACRVPSACSAVV